MKYIFSLFLIIHGVIHLPGFVKAFSIAPVEQLKADISRVNGLLWLMAFMLFTISAIALLAGAQWWKVLSLVAVVLSTILVAGTWSDAKFGTLANIIILLITVISLSTSAYNRKVNNEISLIMEGTDSSYSSAITEKEIEGLPYPVANWLRASGVTGRDKVSKVWLKQKALMKMKPSQEEWNNATAEQYFNTDYPAFIWKVNMNMGPFIKIAGRDKFSGGKGEMQIRMFSIISIADEKGEKIDEGTMQRYLGEIVWFPSAALNQYIRWEAIDSLSARATMSYKGTTASGIFCFNEEGDFTKFSTLRYFGDEEDASRHEWIIRVNGYSTFDGVRIPDRMEATWVLDEGDWTWLKLEIADIKYIR